MTSIEIIKERVSWRTFEKNSISKESRDLLIEYAKKLQKGPFSNQCRFELLTNQNEEFFRKLGTYGMIRGTTDYLAPVIKKGAYDLEDLGHLTELMVLRATDLGLASCWLGGSFTKEHFARAVSLNDDEIIPAVIALGIPKSRRGIVDSIVRMGAGSKSRKDPKELFFENDFKTPFALSGELGQTLEMVRLAPSASNQQPWRIIVNEKGVHFYIYRSPKYQRTLKRFKLFDLQRVDMGIALAHFDLASKELGMRGNFSKVEMELSDTPLGTEYLVSWIS